MNDSKNIINNIGKTKKISIILIISFIILASHLSIQCLHGMVINLTVQCKQMVGLGSLLSIQCVCGALNVVLSIYRIL